MGNSTPHEALKTYWGYEDFLPHQEEVIEHIQTGRDSLTVLPTGGGKSLCFQVPAVCGEGLVVVVSPLVALMKDQVDGLRECGIAAAAIHSGLSFETKRKIFEELRRDELKLIYLAPESLLKPQFLDFLAKLKLQYFVVDEAHCISAWGHDFRPEFQGLATLRQKFSDTPIHAFTATANPRVRDEIVTTLGLQNPQAVVGDFFRANLEYHVVKKANVINQIVAIAERFPNESGIVYCISRDETDSLAQELRNLGYASESYHAGLADDERTKRQEAFINDETRIIVATIAFGMGIDKPNVRFVAHAGMPKSLANYQQESGRAGRDGLEAECWLFYSAGDLLVWKRILEQAPTNGRALNEQSLYDIHNFCVSTRCRHRSLCEHFGQAWARENCGACDVCLGKFEQMADGLVIGQKILSCIVRVQQSFGAAYVANVLKGSNAADIKQRRHDQLSTYGLLKEYRRGDIGDWIEQLLAQGFIVRQGEYSVLCVTDRGKQLLRGEVEPVLSRTATQTSAPTRKGSVESLEGVDMGLFEKLRQWRRELSLQRAVPAYIVCGDVTLRDLARRRPGNLQQPLEVHGLGEKKLADFGETLLETITNYCREHQRPPNPIQTSPSHVDPPNADLCSDS